MKGSMNTMNKIKIGYFERSPWNIVKMLKRLKDASIALGCVTEEEINFGMECLLPLVSLEREYTFDELGMLECEYDVMYLHNKNAGES